MSVCQYNIYPHSINKDIATLMCIAFIPKIDFDLYVQWVADILMFVKIIRTKAELRLEIKLGENFLKVSKLVR